MWSTTDLDVNSALEPTRDRKNGVAPLCFDRRGHERDVGSKHPHHISRTYTRWCRFFWPRHGRRHLPSSRQFQDSRVEPILRKGTSRPSPRATKLCRCIRRRSRASRNSQNQSALLCERRSLKSHRTTRVPLWGSSLLRLGRKTYVQCQLCWLAPSKKESRTVLPESFA